MQQKTARVVSQNCRWVSEFYVVNNHPLKQMA